MIDLNILYIIQIILAVLFSITVLLQQRNTALGSMFGGSSETYSTKRGIQKKVYIASIILFILFFINVLLINYYSK